MLIVGEVGFKVVHGSLSIQPSYAAGLEFDTVG